MTSEHRCDDTAVLDVNGRVCEQSGVQRRAKLCAPVGLLAEQAREAFASRGHH
jgi:hypothetical protein